jgi:hypothetical protein
MHPGVPSILDAHGCDLGLEDPPGQFETTENMIPADAVIANFDTAPLTDLAGQSPLSRTESERYWHVRQYYLTQDRASTRDPIVSEKLARIKATVKSGDRAQVLSLFRQRHIWRQRALECITDGRQICKVENCHHVATAGSDYCINHILLDERQVLFVECPTCHRPYPIMSECFACRLA